MDDLTAPINSGQEAAPWIKGAAFNTYWTYSFIGRSAYYSMIPAQYYDFMSRWVRHWLYWYDGWVPYFHDQEQGIMSTRIATALCDRAAKKVVGGRVMYKNAGKDSSSIMLNGALRFVSGTWAKDVNFSEVVKKAVKYAAAAGTALVKLNKDNTGLWAEALRFDSFLPTVGVRGDIIEVTCFLQSFTQLTQRTKTEDRVQTYYVVEQRYFGDYVKATGEVLHHVPIAEYKVKRADGTITTGNYVSDKGEGVPFATLPKAVRQNIGKAYAGIMFDRPILLPFSDSLGCELVKWTDGISNLPELPFGESLLANLVSLLMSWDYYFSAFNTDMYLGRGRVLAPVGVKSAATNNYNAGLDSFFFSKLPYTNPEEQKPIPIQFDLRSTSWTEIRTMLIQNIAIQTGMNISTIASFLQDSTASVTAREISTQENETAGFVDDKRELVERPLNRILKTVTLYYGYKDDVVIRWSGAGLTNRYTLVELLSQARAAGIVSQYKAVQMFNFDDDDEQTQEEYERIKEESSRGFEGYGDEGIDGDSENGGQAAEQAGLGIGDSTEQDTFGGERGVSGAAK